MRRILCLLVLFILFAMSAHAADTIKIGVMAPLTGNWTSDGKELKQVIELLAQEVNDKGGVLGKKVEIVVENDEGTPQGAVQATLQLLKQGLVAVIGANNSQSTDAAQNMFNEAKIIQISHGATALWLTEKKMKYFFRTCPSDDDQSKVIIQTIQKMNLKRIAIVFDNVLFDNKTSYAKALAESTQSLALQKGLSIVYEDGLTPGLQDYSDVLRKIKVQNPDVVFFAGYYQEAARLLRQKKEMGWNVVFISGDGANNPNLVPIAGKKAAEGFYFVSPPLPGELTSKQTIAFLEKFKSKYGVSLNSIDSVLAGDAFRVIVKAIGETKSTDPDILADHLHTAFVDPSGLTGNINFNPKGNRLSDLYGVYRVDADGRYVVQRMFQYGQIVK
ncbi:MAG: branched-chain amino acid ABC transporter substrate-binding protein [Deltaproteobacteria bacterium]|nr:branched-chain amino acid ABC transporter substrate-binding protein [Deltaproteobacteria bacterium]